MHIKLFIQAKIVIIVLIMYPGDGLLYVHPDGDMDQHIAVPVSI